MLATLKKKFGNMKAIIPKDKKSPDQKEFMKSRLNMQEQKSDKTL